jgi:hypothetical protein
MEATGAGNSSHISAYYRTTGGRLHRLDEAFSDRIGRPIVSVAPTTRRRPVPRGIIRDTQSEDPPKRRLNLCREPVVGSRRRVLDLDYPSSNHEYGRGDDSGRERKSAGVSNSGDFPNCLYQKLF